MGDQVQQMAETAVTDEAEAAGRVEEDRLAKEAAEADAANKADEEFAAPEAAELARRLKRNVKHRISNRTNQEGRGTASCP